MNRNNQTEDNNSKLSDGQMQRMKKYAVFAFMGIVCAGCIWFIFAPSADEKAGQEAQRGFNTEIPDPKNEGIVGDKAAAYEQEQMKQKQAERMRSLEDFSSLLGESDPRQADDPALLPHEPAHTKTGGGVSPKQAAVQNSVNAYRDVNRTLGNFYEKPREDPEKEQLKKELEELKLRMDESENRKRTADEQLALMEKSFQMASRYMPATPETAAAPKVSDVGLAGGNGSGNTAGKVAATPVGGVRERVVSALPQEVSDAEFIEAYGQPRNMGFYTAAGEMRNDRKNTLAASVHADQVVMDGQNVRLRLAEAMQAGGRLIPRGTLLSGTARIQGERLAIQIRSLEYMASIIPLDLSVYDADGQPGVFIPDLQEVHAAKEILANMGASAGTSINLSSDAGEQFAADMGRDLIRGVSQFASKKLREVKVYLKAGYRVFLVSESQLKNESH